MESNPNPPTELGYQPSQLSNPTLAVTVGIIGLRLMGVFSIVMGVTTLPLMFYGLSSMVVTGASVPTPVFVYYVTQPLAYIAVAVVLLLKGPAMSIRMFGDTHSAAGPVSPGDFLTFAVAGIGLFTVVSSVDEVTVGIVSMWNSGGFTTYADRLGIGGPASTLAKLFSVFITILQPVLGLILMWKARAIGEFGVSKYRR